MDRFTGNRILSGDLHERTQSFTDWILKLQRSHVSSRPCSIIDTDQPWSSFDGRVALDKEYKNTVSIQYGGAWKHEYKRTHYKLHNMENTTFTCVCTNKQRSFRSMAGGCRKLQNGIDRKWCGSLVSDRRGSLRTTPFCLPSRQLNTLLIKCRNHLPPVPHEVCKKYS